MAKKTLRERASEMGNLLPFMEDRGKGNPNDLMGVVVVIRDFGFLHDNKNDKDYVVFTVDEEPEKFYFGGLVLTQNLLEFENDGFRKEIEKEGLPVRFGKKENLDPKKNDYTTVELFPTEKI